MRKQTLTKKQIGFAGKSVEALNVKTRGSGLARSASATLEFKCVKLNSELESLGIRQTPQEIPGVLTRCTS